MSATISVNGGPEVPFDVAMKRVKAAASRKRASKDPVQTDLEEATGVPPAQAKREAEAGGIAADRLRFIVQRVERLDEERRSLASDIKDVMAEAKSAGFDVRTVRRIVKLRRMEPAMVEEQDLLLDLYRRALGI